MKTLKLIPLLALAVLMISACNEAPNKDHDAIPEATAATPVLTGKVDTTTAKRWVARFKSRSHKFKENMGDTRCVWFSKDQLKALLSKVDSIQDGDGIRFYLATYDSIPAHGFNNFKPEYANYSTLVMVTTRKGTGLLSGKHMDYYKEQTKLLNGKSVIDAKHSGIIISATPENEGELCPPPAKCNTQGAMLLEQ
ncbi:hypothetical protein [Mucilaginibacter jinjuensis]|uniref:Lipoprotein n=1 Tax=Mucilaginibacter jinjuensis TaxID=1176721 RepID=A0ABY7T3E4_9SPHI|nr:hypothetical protein [Mucilaginibacter jinjuensis]WCT10965.1 hypothetical protein PQO05_19700 [Mucilaginibacter jinjuensis]